MPPAAPGPMPPAWGVLGTHVELWHGCVRSHAATIQANGVSPTAGRPDVDFGRGFYTTTRRDQAERWARKKYRGLTPHKRAGDAPALIRFRVPLDRLAVLASLMFVRGDAGHDAFWSFVAHGRVAGSHLNPGRAAPNDWYDVVCGPLAVAWPPSGRVVFPDHDQFSFHTDAAVAILNDAMMGGPLGFAVTVLPVPPSTPAGGPP